MAYSKQKIQTHMWHELKIKRAGSKGTVILNNEEGDPGRSKGSFTKLDLQDTKMFIGSADEDPNRYVEAAFKRVLVRRE